MHNVLVLKFHAFNVRVYHCIRENMQYVGQVIPSLAEPVFG
jgi:hypothetical protein